MKGWLQSRRRTETAAGDVHVDDLRKLIKSLPAAAPFTAAFEEQTQSQRANTWHQTQQEHLIGWLGQYNSPGAYDRKNPSTSGKHFYNHFRCAPGLMWLAEALGEDPSRLRKGIAAVESAAANPSSQCAAFRREIPWSRIVELIEA